MNPRIALMSSFKYFFLNISFSYYLFFFIKKKDLYHFIRCFSSFKEEVPRLKDEVEQEIIVIRPLSSEPATYLTSLPSSCYGQAIFPTPTSTSSITTTTSTLPTSSFQGSSEDFSLLFFPIHSTLSSSSISLSNSPSHTFADKPVSYLSCTLTSSLPSSLPPSYPIYSPTTIYTYSRPSNFSVGSIPYLYSSVLSTNTLSLSYHGSSSTRVSSASSGPAPSGPKKRATSNRTRDWLRSGPRDNTYFTTKRQGLRPATSDSSFPLLSSWANPSNYQDSPMNLTCISRTNL